MYEKIANHIGHNIEVASYGDPILNVAVECMDCHEVLVDANSCCDHEHEPHFCTHEDEVDGVFVQCACEGS
jgi:hypothetical protein